MVEIGGGLIFGLLVGSFLNVVIYRLPVMMERRWREESRNYLTEMGCKLPAALTPNAAESAPFNLLTPRSTCPACNNPIKAWQNVPVISWLLLRAQCAHCKAPISARYPTIELFTGLLSAAVIWKFGWNPAGWSVLGLSWALIALTVIDIDHQLLPDAITLPLMWAGLTLTALQSALGPAAEALLPDLTDSVLGAIGGYLSLWSVYWAFKLATGKDGMGYGDFKLLAALGAWMGYQMLPLIIVLSAAVGASLGAGMIVIMGRDKQIPIPFGPYLAGAGLIAIMWGPSLIDSYLGYSGLS